MKPTRKQKARAGLAYALTALLAIEQQAKESASTLARAKKVLAHRREVLKIATEDARRAGIL